MRSRTTRFLLALLACSALLGGTLAYAVELQTSPKPIKTLDFETAGSSFTSEYQINQPDVITTAMWGRSTSVKRYGSWGYWCAGTNIKTPGTNTWPSYQVGTRGVSYLPLPELSDYYSSTLSFGYLMPSLGVYDGSSFVVEWQANPSSTWDEGLQSYTDYNIPLTPAGVWTNRSYDLGAGGNLFTKTPLSRHSGIVGFQFLDNMEGGGATPTIGQGPALDNVTVTGYMFGPVRSLASSATDGAVHLSWTPPASSLSSATNDTRPVYRIWRRLKGGGAADWTELTTASGYVGTSYDDPGAVDHIAYDYAVQAWAPAPQQQFWGMLAPTVIGGRHIPTIQPQVALSSSAPFIGFHGSVALTGNFKNAVGTLVPGIQIELQKSVAGGAWSHDETLTSGDGTYSVTRSPFRTTSYRLHFPGDATFFATDSASVKITATPKLTLGPLATTVAYAGTARLTGSLVDTTGTLEPNKNVTLQYSYNKVTLYTKATLSSATGLYSTYVAPAKATYYRIHFGGDAAFGAADSAWVKVTPRVYLTTPTGSTTVYKSRYYTYYGYMKPRQTSGTKPVRIVCYLRTSTGSYVAKKTYYATASNYSSYSKYAAAVRLPYAGRWRIRAYFPATSYYAATYSSYRYVTSK